MSSSSIDALSEQNQARVATILESCLFALEHGEQLSPEELLEAHPDLAEPLGKCLPTLMTLHAAVHGEPTEVEHALEPGTRLGDYLLEEQIGRGGMGVVYRAKQISLERMVALKLLPHGQLLTSAQLRRFNLESRAIAQLHHPNIVPVFAVGQEKDVHYFAMQLINGCSLEKVDYRTWSPQSCRSLITAAIELADALAHAHECGIIHRDIKPSNLLMDGQGHVWITDFGLALCKTDTRLTMSGDLIGTMNYMSPEQSQGKPVDERTDVYSLGATLYELVTGKVAFPGKARAEVFRAIEQDDPISPRKLNAECPYDLETIILKAMSKKRDDRYASAAEMRDDLQRVLNQEAIVARRPSHRQRAWRWAERHRSLVTVAGIGLAATCLSITVGAVQVLLTRSELHASRLESQSHLELAEDNYWQGRNLVQRWNKDIFTKLADIPGTDNLHASMLADTIEYYQAFLDRAQSQSQLSPSGQALDPNLNKDVAAARLSLAAALDASGQTQPAITAYRQAIDQLKQLARTEPDVAARLAVAHNDLAVVLLRTEQVREAKAQLRDALQCLDEKSSATEDLAAAVHANMARAEQALGDSAAYLKHLEQAEQLYRSALTHSSNQQAQAALQSELGAVLDQQVVALIVGQEVGRASRPVSPMNDETVGRVSRPVSPETVGRVSRPVRPMNDGPGDPSYSSVNALDLTLQAVGLHQSSCQATSPPPIDRQRRLAASLHNRAVLLLDNGELDASREAFQQAIAEKLTIAKRTGLKAGTSADAAATYLALGRLEARQDRSAEALKCFAQAIAAAEHDASSLPSIENKLLLAEALGSHLRISRDEEIRLELSSQLAKIEATKLNKTQSQSLTRLQALVKSLKENEPPESPDQSSLKQTDATSSEQLLETPR